MRKGNQPERERRERLANRRIEFGEECARGVERALLANAVPEFDLIGNIRKPRHHADIENAARQRAKRVADHQSPVDPCFAVLREDTHEAQHDGQRREYRQCDRRDDNRRALFEPAVELGGKGESKHVADQTRVEAYVRQFARGEFPVIDLHVHADAAADAKHHRQAEKRDHQEEIVAVGKRLDQVPQKVAHGERRRVRVRLRHVGNAVTGKPGGRKKDHDDRERHGRRERRVARLVQQRVPRDPCGCEEDQLVHLEHRGAADPVEEVVVAHHGRAARIGLCELSAHGEMGHVIDRHQRSKHDGPERQPTEQLILAEPVQRVEDAPEREGDGQRREQHEGVPAAPLLRAKAVGE